MRAKKLISNHSFATLLCRLECQCISAIAFVKNEPQLLDSPIWIMLINVVALEMLKAKIPRNASRGEPTSSSFLLYLKSDRVVYPMMINPFYGLLDFRIIAGSKSLSTTATFEKKDTLRSYIMHECTTVVYRKLDYFSILGQIQFQSRDQSRYSSPI